MRLTSQLPLPRRRTHNNRQTTIPTSSINPRVSDRNGASQGSDGNRSCVESLSQPPSQVLVQGTATVHNVSVLANPASSSSPDASSQSQRPLDASPLQPPVKQPKNPLRHSAVPWPQDPSSSPPAEPDGFKSIRGCSAIGHQDLVQEQCFTSQNGAEEHHRYQQSYSGEALRILGSARQAKASDTSGQAELPVAQTRPDAMPQQLLPPDSPLHPIWDRDDELYGHRKAERVKRRKVEQWAREVRQQAQRGQSPSRRANSSDRASGSIRGHEHVLVEADEADLPASITLTYGPTFGATFGDVYGGRGRLFSEGALLSRNVSVVTTPSGRVVSPYLNPWYGLVDCNRLSKEALDAHNALYAYRQRKEQDLESAKLYRGNSIVTTAPQSGESRTSSQLTTRRRTDQTRLDPFDAFIVRQRSSHPVVPPSKGNREQREDDRIESWHRDRLDNDEGTSAQRTANTSASTSTKKDHVSNLCFAPVNPSSPCPPPEVDSTHTYNPISSDNSARKVATDEILRLLEEGPSTQSGTSGAQSSRGGRAQRGTSTYGRQSVTSPSHKALFPSIDQPSSVLSPRHMEAEIMEPGTVLDSSRYLHQEHMTTRRSSLERFYYESPEARLSGSVSATLQQKQDQSRGDALATIQPGDVHDLAIHQMDLDETEQPEHVEVSDAIRAQWLLRSTDPGRRLEFHRGEKRKSCGPTPACSSAGSAAGEPVAPDLQEARSFHPAGSSDPAAAALPSQGPIVIDEDRYRPRPPLPVLQESVNAEHTFEPSSGAPPQSSLSGSLETYTSMEAGDQTYIKLWQAIQSMIASSGNESRSSVHSTSSGLPSSYLPGSYSVPSQVGARINAAKPSLATDEIPTLELDNNTGLQAGSVSRRVPGKEKRDVPDGIPATANAGGAGEEYRRRLLSPQSSSGRLNIQASQAITSQNQQGFYHVSKPPHPLAPVPISSATVGSGASPSVRSTLDVPMSSSSSAISDAQRPSNVYPNHQGKIQRTIPVPSVIEHLHHHHHQYPNTSSPIDGSPNLSQQEVHHPPTSRNLVGGNGGGGGGGGGGGEVSLRKYASRQSLKVMKSDISMKTAGSCYHENINENEVMDENGEMMMMMVVGSAGWDGDLSGGGGGLNHGGSGGGGSGGGDHRSDIIMRTASGHSSRRDPDESTTTTQVRISVPSRERDPQQEDSRSSFTGDVGMEYLQKVRGYALRGRKEISRML